MEWGTGICRCCLSQGEASHKDLNTTNFWMGEEEVYSEMLKECFDITLSISDPVGDSGICEMCITQLRNSFNFKKQVLHSEEQFLKRIHERIKEEESRELIKSETEDFSDDDYEPEYLDESLLTIEKVDVPIKGEMDDEEPSSSRKRTRASTKPTLKAKKAKKDDKCTKSKTQTSKSITSSMDGIIIKKIKKTNKRNKHVTNARTILECSNVCPFKDANRYIICEFCSESFHNGRDFRKHVLKNHDAARSTFSLGKGLKEYVLKVDVTDLICTLCDTEMSDLNDLKKHLVEDHSRIYYMDILDHIVPFKIDDINNFQCVMCPQKFDSFQTVYIHMNCHYNHFCCDVCGAGFITGGRLKSHKARHEFGAFKCQYCEKEFQSVAKRSMHMNGVHLGEMLKNPPSTDADLIPKVLVEKYKNEFNVRVLLEFSNLSPFKDIAKNKGILCEFCQEFFKDDEEFRIHARKDHQIDRREFTIGRKELQDFTVKVDITDMRCGICFDLMADISELRQHLETKHHKEFFDDIPDRFIPFKVDLNEFKCVICESTLDNFNTLHIHMNSHSNNFCCDFCGASFITTARLRKHIFLHKEGNYKCNYCDKVFTSQVKRKKHENGVHYGQWHKFKCELCDKVFAAAYARDKHLELEHGYEAKKFKCVYAECEKAFFSRVHLNLHVRKVHLGEKKAKCSTCDRMFFDANQLSKHMIKHTGEKTFECQICERKFLRKKNLFQHYKIHDKGSRYSCLICDEVFETKTCFNNHLKIHESGTVQEDLTEDYCIEEEVVVEFADV